MIIKRQCRVQSDTQIFGILASLTESYNVLMTALEAKSEDIPKWELVTERLLHQESKFKITMPLEDGHKTLTAGQNKGLRKPFPCHYCHKRGYFKKDSRKYLAAQKKQANAAEKKQTPCSDGEALVTIHALAAISSGTWILIKLSCHMCNDKIVY